MERLATEQFLFVLDDFIITGFVTPADPGSVAVRSHFYVRLAQLETALSQHLRERYLEQQEAVVLLNRARQAKQQQFAAELKAQDNFIDDLVTNAGKDAAYREATRATASVGAVRPAASPTCETRSCTLLARSRRLPIR